MRPFRIDWFVPDSGLVFILIMYLSFMGSRLYFSRTSLDSKK